MADRERDQLAEPFPVRERDDGGARDDADRRPDAWQQVGPSASTVIERW